MHEDTYIWKPGSQITGIDPKAAYERMEAIRIRAGGLTAESLLEDARDPQSIFHDQFARNSELYQLEQARQLIQSLMVEHQEVDQSVRTYHLVWETGADEPRRIAPPSVGGEATMAESSHEKKAPVFLHFIVDQSRAEATGQYAISTHTTEEALKEPAIRGKVVATALEELAAWREKYDGFPELADLRAAINDTVQQFTERHGR
jgi:hypothetical protein